MAEAEKTIELTKAQLEDKVKELSSANAELLGQTYVANIVAAQANIQAGEITTARTRLDQAPADLRGWEWKSLAMKTRAMMDHGRPQRREGVDCKRWKKSLVTSRL